MQGAIHRILLNYFSMQMSPKTVNYGGKNLGFGDGQFLQKTWVSVSVLDTVTTLENILLYQILGGSN